MELKFLTDLGVSEEAAQKIIEANKTEIEAEQGAAADAAKQLEAASQTIKDLRETTKKFDGKDPDALQKDLDDLQAKYDADTAALKRDAALDRALLSAKARDVRAVKPLLDLDAVKLDGDKLIGLEEQLTSLKADHDYLFEPSEPAGGTVKVDTGDDHKEPAGGGLTLDDELKAAMFGA